MFLKNGYTKKSFSDPKSAVWVTFDGRAQQTSAKVKEKLTNDYRMRTMANHSRFISAP